jgi:hypothetical protein
MMMMLGCVAVIETVSGSGAVGEWDGGVSSAQVVRKRVSRVMRMMYAARVGIGAKVGIMGD